MRRKWATLGYRILRISHFFQVSQEADLVFVEG
jgi:hypothetical protein